MKRVYIAGPYTKGDVALNVRAAILAAGAVFDAGFAPFVPHLTHFWHLLAPRDYEDWLRLDLEWLACCHCLIRLNGESSGADREVARARELGIPVYFDLRDFLDATERNESPGHVLREEDKG